jgi:hypothetical protein
MVFSIAKGDSLVDAFRLGRRGRCRGTDQRGDRAVPRRRGLSAELAGADRIPMS